MAKRTWYEVVVVLSRHEDGFPKEFYPGDTKHHLLGSAKRELSSLRKQFPEDDYAIVSNTSTVLALK